MEANRPVADTAAAARHAQLVGRNLRDLRRDRGYSQGLLAGLVEVDRNHISEWEDGRHQPSAATSTRSPPRSTATGPTSTAAAATDPA
jgi:DNA-binding transcriptional regulator YiaG